MNRARPTAARLKKPRVNHEPCSAHGRAVKKPRVNHEPRSAHGRAVKKNNKPRVEHEPRSAHGRAVKKKPRVNHEPRSAYGRAVNKVRVYLLTRRSTSRQRIVLLRIDRIHRSIKGQDPIVR